MASEWKGRLRDWRRFGIAAGLTTAVFVPAFMQTMNVLSGDGIAVH